MRQGKCRLCQITIQEDTRICPGCGERNPWKKAIHIEKETSATPLQPPPPPPPPTKMKESSAHTLGLGLGQLLNGKFLAAAKTWKLRIWLGRYCGFVLGLLAILMLLGSLAGLPITPASLTELFVTMAIASLFLFPLAILGFFSLFGKWTYSFRATSFWGAGMEGFGCAVSFFVLYTLLRWIQKEPPPFHEPPLPQLSMPQPQQPFNLDLFVAETPQYRGFSDFFDEQMKRDEAFGSLDPDDPASSPGVRAFLQGRELVEVGRFEEARDAYTLALENDPQLWPAYQKRGELAAALGDFDSAAKDFSAALRIESELSVLYLDRAYAYSQLGNFPQVVEDCNAALDLDCFSVDGLNLRGLALSFLQEHRRAIQDFTTALRLDPSQVAIFSNRAFSLLALGAYQEAIADCNRAIRLDPTHPDAYDRRGQVYRALGEWKNALQDFDRAIELNPDFGSAYCNRALLRSHATDQTIFNPSLAIKDAQQACEISGWQDFTAIYLLALVYITAGQIDDGRWTSDLMVEAAPPQFKERAKALRSELKVMIEKQSP
ncbi:Hypothetical protein PBC10988_35070 [Planctomycetales bacterium 10988]|nr:Hypothetical protein PBC10988_35070 [Planctomycetales bacterium 10988]